MLHRAALGLLFFCLVAIGCGSESASSTPSDEADRNPSASSSSLAACAPPTSCSWPVSSGSPSEADGPRCVVAELSNGRALSVDTKLVADGPSDGCEVHQQLYFFAEKGVVYDVWRKKCGASETNVVKRCTMLGKEAYATCLSDFDATRTSTEGTKCSLPSEWMTDCKEVEAAVCP